MRLKGTNHSTATERCGRCVGGVHETVGIWSDPCEIQVPWWGGTWPDLGSVRLTSRLPIQPRSKPTRPRILHRRPHPGLVLPFSHNLDGMLQGWVHGLAPGRVRPALQRRPRSGLVTGMLRPVGSWPRVTRAHPRNGRSSALAGRRAGGCGVWTPSVRGKGGRAGVAGGRRGRSSCTPAARQSRRGYRTGARWFRAE